MLTPSCTTLVLLSRPLSPPDDGYRWYLRRLKGHLPGLSKTSSTMNRKERFSELGPHVRRPSGESESSVQGRKQRVIRALLVQVRIENLDDGIVVRRPRMKFGIGSVWFGTTSVAGLNHGGVCPTKIHSHYPGARTDRLRHQRVEPLVGRQRYSEVLLSKTLHKERCLHQPE